MAKIEGKKSGVSYEVSAAYKKKDLLTIRNKQHVNITGGEIPVKTKVSKQRASRQYSYRAGNEDDRKWYYELNLLRDAEGNPIKDAQGNEISKQKAIIKVNANTDTPSDE